MAMRYNTLQLVNKILNGLDLQPVSTLGETEDAEQALSLLDRAFVELELDINWFPKRDTVALSTASGITETNWLINYPDIPWAMKIPVGVEAVYQVYYNGKLIQPVTPEEFYYKIEKTIAFKNTGDPLLWTMGLKDEDYIVFDNFDSATETRLTSSNSTARVTRVTQATLAADGDVIELSEKYFASLMHKALAFGFLEILHDVSRADRYNRYYEISKSKVNANNRRFKPHVFSLGNYDFSRKPRRGRFQINDSFYNDIST